MLFFVTSNWICYDKYIFALLRMLDILTIFTCEYRVLTGNLEFYIGGDRKWNKLKLSLSVQLGLVLIKSCAKFQVCCTPPFGRLRKVGDHPWDVVFQLFLIIFKRCRITLFNCQRLFITVYLCSIIFILIVSWSVWEV